MALTTGPGTTTGLVPFRRPYYAPWGMPLGLERPRLSIDRRSAQPLSPAELLRHLFAIEAPPRRLAICASPPITGRGGEGDVGEKEEEVKAVCTVEPTDGATSPTRFALSPPLSLSLPLQLPMSRYRSPQRRARTGARPTSISALPTPPPVPPVMAKACSGVAVSSSASVTVIIRLPLDRKTAVLPSPPLPSLSPAAKQSSCSSMDTPSATNAVVLAWAAKGWHVPSGSVAWDVEPELLLDKIWGIYTCHRQLRAHSTVSEPAHSTKTKQLPAVPSSPANETTKPEDPTITTITATFSQLTLSPCQHGHLKRPLSPTQATLPFPQPPLHRRRITTAPSSPTKPTKPTTELILFTAASYPCFPHSSACPPLATKTTLLLPPAPAPAENLRSQRHFCGDHDDDNEEGVEMEEVEFAGVDEDMEGEDGDAGCGSDDYEKFPECWRKGMRRCCSRYGYENCLEAVQEIVLEEEAQDDHSDHDDSGASFLAAASSSSTSTSPSNQPRTPPSSPPRDPTHTHYRTVSTSSTSAFSPISSKASQLLLEAHPAALPRERRRHRSPLAFVEKIWGFKRRHSAAEGGKAGREGRGLKIFKRGRD
ncbi:hypothetical protein BZA05DRAFT_388170 [Tricharina praecox]|uniref:uncharacterized protein n=1 Tax=Tricharina praecox TaxID=43433 RepID=UPI00221EF29C|nr:uncharacterized protein BZA05DRAFT_388170 [Tricharina praecox]KAI5856335.1 hypothetical protein BZA05DRAFT_388170 [Tricharina praecox]